MSEHKVLFAVTRDHEGKVNFQVISSEKQYITENKNEILAMLDQLKDSLIAGTFPFHQTSVSGESNRIFELLKKVGTDEQRRLRELADEGQEVSRKKLEVIENAKATVLGINDLFIRQVLQNVQNEFNVDAHILVQNDNIFIEYGDGKPVDTHLTTEELVRLLECSVSVKRIAMKMISVSQMKYRF